MLSLLSEIEVSQVDASWLDILADCSKLRQYQIGNPAQGNFFRECKLSIFFACVEMFLLQLQSRVMCTRSLPV